MPRETKILVFSSSTTGAVPPGLYKGEFAANLEDEILFVGKGDGAGGTSNDWFALTAGAGGGGGGLISGDYVRTVSGTTGDISLNASNGITYTISGTSHNFKINIPSLANRTPTATDELIISEKNGLTAFKTPVGRLLQTSYLQAPSNVSNLASSQFMFFNMGTSAQEISSFTTVSSAILDGAVTSFNGLTGAVTYAPPLASASITGLASFNNEFVVSALGAVSLTSNHVRSLNGCTGALTITGTVDEIEVTGSCPQIVVGLPDTVTIQRLNVVNTLTAGFFEGPLLGRVTAPVKNLDSITLTAGTPVYISGYLGSGASGVLEVKAAQAGSASAMPAVGLLETTLAPNDQGHVVELGLLGSLNTNGFVSGQTVFIGPNGGLTATRPTSGDHLVQNIGRVVNASVTQGQIIVLGPGRTNDVPNNIVIRGYLQMPNGQTATSLVTTFNGLSGAVSYAPPLASSSVTGVASFGNQFTVSALGAVGLTSNYVVSVNGLTGAVTNVAQTNVAQTFTATQSFSAGLTATGATFSGNISAPNILSWSVITADQTAAVNSGYFTNKGTLLTLTLPVSASVGSVIRVSGMNAGLWKIAQNASQVIHFGKTDTTTGTGGYLQATQTRDTVELVCCVANNEWNVVSSIGNMTIV